jgi:hypothetical protein
MFSPLSEAPPGYQDLCDQLQIERDPAQFRLLVERINCLLTAHEKSDVSGERRVQTNHISVDVLPAAEI